MYFLQQWENKPHIVLLFHCCSCDLNSSHFLQNQSKTKHQKETNALASYDIFYDVGLSWASQNGKLPKIMIQYSTVAGPATKYISYT